MRTLSIAALAILGLTLGAARTSAQLGTETLVLSDGTTLSGELVTIEESSFVIARRMGEGSARQIVPFTRVQPEALYGILLRALMPLEGGDHLRLADVAYKAGIFGAAAHHYQDYAKSQGGATAEIAAKITDAQAKDITVLMDRAKEDMEREAFVAARKIAMEAMRRYPTHPDVKPIPAFLEEITKIALDAQRRDAALATSKKAKAEWERGERALADVEKWIERAKESEAQALRATAQFNIAKDALDTAIKFTRNAEDDVKDLRQKRGLPNGLRPSLVKLQEEARALEIRLRLHLASAYTVRGSYGTAMNYVNAALAFDPTDEQALAARGRIEEAAAYSSSRSRNGAGRTTTN